MNKSIGITLKNKSKLTILILMIVLSIIIRIINIDIPIGADTHNMRQTHTAIAVQEYINDGYTGANYQVPVFGPPWNTVLFEFPVYQTSVYIFKIITSIDNLDVACRLVDMIYFYISAILLFFLCKMYLNKNQPISIFLFYIFVPFNIFWSRTAMIEFCSLAFGLAYVLLLLKWLRKSGFIFYLSSILVGSLAYLSKSTTMFPIIMLLAALILFELLMEFKSQYTIINTNNVLEYVRLNIFKLSMLFTICLIPVLVGSAWNKYADVIKASSIYTQQLTSANLKTWNFGTLHNKVIFDNWLVIINRILKYFFPAFNLIILPFIFIKISGFKKTQEKVISIASILVIPLTIFILFNLYYIHDYYLCALSPYICILGGIGINCIYEYLERFRVKKLLTFILIIIAVVSCFPSSEYLYYLYDRGLVQQKMKYPELGEFIKNITERNEYVIFTHNDWSPSILYYANRKGFAIINQDQPNKEKLFKENNFTTIVTQPRTPDIEGLISNWKYFYKYGNSGWYIYKVYDDPKNIDKILSGYNRYKLLPKDIEYVNMANVEVVDNNLVVRCTGSDIFIIYKLNEVKNTKAVLVEFDTIDERDEMQIYYKRKNEQYDENKKICFDVFPGHNKYYIDLENQANDIDSIRIDLGTKSYKEYRITNFEMFNK